MSASELWSLLVIVGLALVTVLTRSFFFISDADWKLPRWAERGLQYAPIAALSAVVMPEVLMSQGQLTDSWRDARIFGALAGVAAYWFKRSTLLTIVVGMAVYLPLRLGLGW